MTPTILVTGFDAFAGQVTNPTSQLLGLLPSKVGNFRIITLELPTAFGPVAALLEQAIRTWRPTYVLAMGQAGGRDKLSIERVAINIDDARIADNEGAQPIDQPINGSGPAAYFSNLPIKRLVAKLSAAQIPAEVSNTAGTYVCNHVMYQLLDLQANNYPNMKVGFIHVPYLPEQVSSQSTLPSMALETMQQGIQLVLQTLAESGQALDDVRVGGSLH